MVPVLPESFLNRLQKNRRLREKWAQRRGVSCYRLYDHDIPEAPLIIDRYEDTFVVASLGRTEGFYEALQAESSALAEVLGAATSQLRLRQRARQKGSLQYEKRGGVAEPREVFEHDLCFEIDLNQYLDVGLFLDHRKTRAWVRSLIEGWKDQQTRCLNLFCYTGSVSVAMAKAGATVVDSVDMSRTYLAWLERNYALNGFEGDTRRGQRLHQIQADITAWLKEAVVEKFGSYDFIFLDPPSFSNSKRMQGTFDVARDFVWLLRQCTKLLKKDGLLFFSNNKRGFSMPSDVLNGYVAECVTTLTQSHDFSQRPAHQSYLLARETEIVDSAKKVLKSLGGDF